MNEQLNISFIKLPHSDKAVFKKIIIITTLVFYISSIVYIKLQTKLYQSSGAIVFNWQNKSVNKLLKYNKTIDFEDILKKIIYSDDLSLITINSLGLTEKNSSTQDVIKNLTTRINLTASKDNNLKFTIELVSSEPVKATKIINGILKGINECSGKIIDNLIVEKEKEFAELSLQKNENEILNFKDLIEKSKDEIILMKYLFKEQKFKFEIVESDIPRKPFYPGKRQSALIGLVLGLIFGIIFSFIVLFFKFLNINNISIFENR